MAVNLSPVGGVAAQFFDNSGNVLTGGKLYTYAAGTTTPAVTYTTSAGNIPQPNPIILNASGRVPGSGEIWLTDGILYKFVLTDSNDVLIATYDNINGINSNFVAFTNQQEIQTATAGQTVFNLISTTYQPGTNSLSVFVDGVNQYGPGAQYAYLETDQDTVTFVNGLHVGALVKFTTSQLNSSGAASAAQVSFTGFKGQSGNVQNLADDDGSDWIGFEQAGTGAVAVSAQDKMRENVSVLDFGADPTGATNSSADFDAAAAASTVVIIPEGGTYKLDTDVSSASLFINYGSTFTNKVPSVMLDYSTVGKIRFNGDMVVNSINNGPLAGTKNPIVNGSFDIWQLGTSFTLGPNLQKNADRWNFDFNGTIGTGSVTRLTVPSADYTDEFHPIYAARAAITVAGSANTFIDLSTQIENARIFSGEQITISFYAKSLSGLPQAITAIKTEQYFGSGGSPSAPAFTTSAPITIGTTWQRYSVTETLASVTGKTFGTNGDSTLNVIITLPLNVVFDLAFTMVQIELGPVATPYEYRSIADIMSECQRYLQVSYNDAVTPGTVTSIGAVFFTQPNATTVTNVTLNNPMRTPPAVAVYNPATGATGTWNNAGTPLTTTLNQNGMKNVSIQTVGGVDGTFVSGHYVFQDPLL
jgi:hypothetical protein